MSSENVKILRNSAFLFSRLLITLILGLFTSRFVIRSLGASDFGLYTVVGGIVVMMAFFNTVMTSTTYRYIAFEMGTGNSEGIIKVFNISLVIHLCLALLLLFFTETAGVYYVKHYLNVDANKVSDALFILRLSTFAVFFSIISIPFQGLITAQENFATQAAIEIIRSILALFVAIVIMFYGGSKLRLYVLLIALVNIVPAVLYYSYCKRKYVEITKWKFQRDKTKYKEMIGFSGWIMLGAASSAGQTTGSELLINSFFGTVLNASFGIAKQVNSFIAMFANNLSQAVVPQITKSFSSGNTDRTINLAAYSSKYIIFLTLIPALPVLLETKFLLTLWLGELPPYTVIFCKLMIVNALISSLGSGLPAVIQATGEIKYFQIILSATTLVCLPIGYLLFKIGYPPYSIMLAFIAAASINVISWQVLLKNIIDFDIIFFLKTSYLKVIYVSAFAAPMFLIKDLLPYGILRFIVVSILSVVGLLLAIYFIGLEKREKEMMKQIVMNLVNQKKADHE